MKCQSCDTANDDDAKFCKACATPLERVGDAQEIRLLRTAVDELTARIAAQETRLAADTRPIADEVRTLARRLDASWVSLQKKVDEHAERLAAVEDGGGKSVVKKVDRVGERLAALAEEIAEVRKSLGFDVAAINGRLAASSVFAHDFFPRAFAIWGHTVTIGALVGLAIGAVALSMK